MAEAEPSEAQLVSAANVEAKTELSPGAPPPPLEGNLVVVVQAQEACFKASYNIGDHHRRVSTHMLRCTVAAILRRCSWLARAFSLAAWPSNVGDVFHRSIPEALHRQLLASRSNTLKFSQSTSAGHRMPSHGGGTNRGARLRGKVLDFWGLGRPERPGNASKRWGAKPPTFLRDSQAARGRPDPPNPGFSL